MMGYDRRVRRHELAGRDTAADMIDSTVVQAHHCAVGITLMVRPEPPATLADACAMAIEAEIENIAPYDR